MNKWFRGFLLVIATVCFAWLIFTSANSLIAIGKIILIAFLLVGMEAMKRDKDKAFMMHTDLEELKKMDEQQFVAYVAQLYKQLGYYVDFIKTEEEIGCDLIIKKNGKVTCVRCIKADKEVGIAPLQQVCGTINWYKADACKVVAFAPYSKKAQRFAALNHIQLVDQNKLISLMNKALKLQIQVPKEVVPQS